MEWISVEDRLPEENQSVWVYGGDSYESYGMAFAIYSDGQFYDGQVCTDKEFNSDVTHWMPLPPAPTADKED